MFYTTLRCFDGFKCLAGRCPDTCCVGWQVDLDDETTEKYRLEPGPLGEKLREKLTEDEGYSCFQMEEGNRCPFLNRSNLCELILKKGESFLSETCREHPRFHEDYGEFIESCLSISCPEAARLLLTADGFYLKTHRDELLPDEPLSEEDNNLLYRYVDYRDSFTRIASGHTLKEAIVILGNVSDLFAARSFGLDFPPEHFREKKDYPLSLKTYFAAIEGLEFTRTELKNILMKTGRKTEKQLLSPLSLPEYDAPARILLCYFLYRYILKAVWEDNLPERIRFCFYSATAIVSLSQFFREKDPMERLIHSAYLFSREIEHSEENLSALFDILFLPPEYIS